MPYVNVHVDIEDVIGDMTDAELREELLRRAKKKGGGYIDDFRIPVGAARIALDDASRLLRKQGRVDLAFKLDEIREDYLP